MTSVTPRALEGVRVLDLSRILAGPTAAQMLGDFGAEVIKVEKPGAGDDSRRLGGPALKTKDGKPSEFSPMYTCSNRNKKGIAIDIAHPEGQELVRQLAAWADVLIENYKAGDLKRYGLDYDSLRKVNRKLVYCSITGFGQTGPYAARAGYDPIFQAMGGLMSVSGHPDGAPGGGVMRVGVPIADFICGVYAYGAILTALHYRDQTSGEGQHIDLALLDTTISATTVAMTNYLGNGALPQRVGNSAPTSSPSGVYPCADGEVLISSPTNDVFRRMCVALGHGKIADDPRYATNQLRVDNRVELVRKMEEIFAPRKRVELMELMEANTVPCAPIYAMNDVFNDPQVKHRVNSVEVPHPTVKKMAFGTNPIHMSETPPSDYTAPPAVGEHTMHVLTNILKLDAERIDELRGKKVV
jgi:crotonobetainyl-CoA:carnitine CoA-transferase CaiB-like acyl-CoA transferase